MSKEKSVSSRMWIFHSILAMLLFALGNVLNAMVAADVGPFAFFYWCSGSLIVCSLQHVYQSYQQYRNGGICWADFNFVKDGSVRWINVLGFVASTVILLLNANLVNMCLWTANLAQINVGVIAVVWSMTPLLQALFDLILFGQKLTYNLWLGMVLMVGACALLSMQPMIIGTKIAEMNLGNVQGKPAESVLPSWIPVLFGFITPFSFTSGNITIRYLNDEKYGINFTSD